MSPDLKDVDKDVGITNGELSVTKSRIEENTKIYDFELDKEDLQTLHTKEYSPSAWVCASFDPRHNFKTVATNVATTGSD